VNASGPADAAQGKPIAAEAFLGALAEHGVDFFFANPGTDFPPIVEAFGRARSSNVKLPRPVLVPHENLAVAMAHGAYAMTGRPQAVMVHVNVGTGNTVNNLINLSRDRVPLILAAGRTPITERGSFGSRSRPIHWGQEMFDQAGMVREVVKWDYELRMPGQAAEVVARAHEVTMTSPRGPVYLVLPREPLSATLNELPSSPPRPAPARPHPDPAAVEQLAAWIAQAERPLVIAAASGESAQAVEALARIAEYAAIPVVCHNARQLCLPSSHPLHFGFDSGPFVAEADLIIVLESDAPWYPSMQQPAPGCRVVHVGEDPNFVRYPMRGFPTDLGITASAETFLTALEAALTRHFAADDARLAARRASLAARNKARRSRLEEQVSALGEHITVPALSRAIGDAVGSDAIIFNEYPLSLEHCAREKPGSYFGLSPAGGLGWGLGAALGAKLAAPEKLIVATIGDGAYLFTNPTVAHWVSAVHDLPVLTVVFNNSRYGAVRRATLSMFKNGAAGEDDGRFLADLDPAPAYDELVRVQGGYGERVERPEDLAAALARARDAVERERRQALLNVICPY
jgi:acetolactate synthase I/II/III large subunit